MLEKILDKYYAKKLIDKIYIDLSLYYIDKKVIYTKYNFNLYFKKKEWKDSAYVLVLSLPYNECFDIFINGYDELSISIQEIIKERLEK